MTARPSDSLQSEDKTGFWFVHDPKYEYAIAGVPIVVGILLILGFFVFPWFSVNEDAVQNAAEDAANNADNLVEETADLFGIDEDDARERLSDQSVPDEFSKTPWQIWTGSDENAILRLDEDYEPGDNGFGEVDSRDRLLILIPLLAIGLITVGGLYVSGRLDQRSTLMASMAAALVLFLLPLLWQGLKTSYIRGTISEQAEKSSFDDDTKDELVNYSTAIYVSAYSTFEFVFLSFIALLFSVGTYLILQSEHKRLGTSWPPPINPFAGFSSGRTAGTAPPAPPPSSPPPAA